MRAHVQRLAGEMLNVCGMQMPLIAAAEASLSEAPTFDALQIPIGHTRQMDILNCCRGFYCFCCLLH